MGPQVKSRVYYWIKNGMSFAVTVAKRCLRNANGRDVIDAL
jgi:hypothetical protein